MELDLDAVPGELEIRLYANTGKDHLAMVSVALVFQSSQIKLPAAQKDGIKYNSPADDSRFTTAHEEWNWGGKKGSFYSSSPCQDFGEPEEREVLLVFHCHLWAGGDTTYGDDIPVVTWRFKLVAGATYNKGLV